MKPKISWACKKSPFLPPVKTVLGQLPPRTIAPTLALTLKLTLTGERSFLWGELQTTETKNRKEIKNNRTKKKEIKQKTLSFKLKQTFPKTRTFKSSSWDKIDDYQNPYKWLKCNIDPFLIYTVETLSSVLRFKTCFSTFLKSTTNKETKILFSNN